MRVLLSAASTLPPSGPGWIPMPGSAQELCQPSTPGRRLRAGAGCFHSSDASPAGAARQVGARDRGRPITVPAAVGQRCAGRGAAPNECCARWCWSSLALARPFLRPCTAARNMSPMIRRFPNPMARRITSVEAGWAPHPWPRGELIPASEPGGLDEIGHRRPGTGLQVFSRSGADALAAAPGGGRKRERMPNVDMWQGEAARWWRGSGTRARLPRECPGSD